MWVIHYYHYFHPRILACDSDLYIQGPEYFPQIPRTQNAKNWALLCSLGLVPIPLLLNLWLPKSESWMPSFLTLFFKIALFQWCPNNVNFLNVFLFILLLLSVVITSVHHHVAVSTQSLLTCFANQQTLLMIINNTLGICDNRLPPTPNKLSSF